MFEELLLVLQPLSLLTFNLDLLFQHHHLEPSNPSPEIPSPPCQAAGRRLTPKEPQSKITGGRYIETLSEVDFGSPEHQAATNGAKPSSCVNPNNRGSEWSTNNNVPPTKASVTLGQTSPQLMWVQEKELSELSPPSIEEESFAQQAGQVVHVAV